LTDDSLIECDILIVGAGMGGGAMAYKLSSLGVSVVVVERGDFLPREPQNSNASEVFEAQRYRTAEPWVNAATGSEFQPGVHYHVGGNTKFYGACLPRFREADFGAIEHREGMSRPWALSYDELEPFYGEAERALLVHGDDTGDDTAPRRSTPYPFAALQHEPTIAALAEGWKACDLQPITMPVGIDLREGGSCVRCSSCDGFPCQYGAKADAETSFVGPALRTGAVQLLTNARVLQLQTRGRRVIGATVRTSSGSVTVRCDRAVLAAGAVNTAALLLASGDPNGSGIANGSGLVGQNYMTHNSTFMVAVDPRRKNTTQFQKTLGTNEWYSAGDTTPYPLGNVQMLGKLQTPMVTAARPYVPRAMLTAMTHRSVDLYLTSEDLASSHNRVQLGANGQIRISWAANNLRSHSELVKRMTRIMRSAGYPLVFTQRMGIETNSHMCGTAVMGGDGATSVVDRNCRTHDLDNLWIVDSSWFPSSAAMNPALTIAANALRVAHQVGR
jgi:choline dehydrogenase-like flavoprotein